MIFSAAWRDGFFGRFLSALEPKKVVQNGVPKKKLNDFLLFFFVSFISFIPFISFMSFAAGLGTAGGAP